jgi:hypothetical protein
MEQPSATPVMQALGFCIQHCGSDSFRHFIGQSGLRSGQRPGEMRGDISGIESVIGAGASTLRPVPARVQTLSSQQLRRGSAGGRPVCKSVGRPARGSASAEATWAKKAAAGFVEHEL